MSSENKDSTSTPPPTQPDTSYYERKKNIISGIDNGHLGVGLGLTALAVGVFASMPMIKDAWEKFVNRPPPPPVVAPQPAIEEYIPPTPPLPQPNGHATEQETPPPPVVEPPKEEEEDGLFHETELRRRQKLMGQKQRGSRYDSPFGKDIGGL